MEKSFTDSLNLKCLFCLAAAQPWTDGNIHILINHASNWLRLLNQSITEVIQQPTLTCRSMN